MLKNLALLADYLETSVPPEKFYIGTFRGAYDFMPRTDHNLIHECGTTACAIGWACVISELKAAGLRYNTKEREVQINGLEVGVCGGNLGPLAELFGVTEEHILWLFYPSKYPYGRETSLPQVIARMRHLLAGGDMSSYSDPVVP